MTGARGTAAKHADIVNFLSMGDRSHLEDRVRHFHECAGDRLPEVELSFGFIQAAIDAPDDLSVLKLVAPDAPEEVLRSLIATSRDRSSALRSGSSRCTKNSASPTSR